LRPVPPLIGEVFDASSRSAYAHASALAHSKGHVSQGAAGTGAGSGERERWAKNIERGGRVLEAVNSREIRGSRTTNDFARRRVRQAVHREYLLIEQTETWCDFDRPGCGPDIKESRVRPEGTRLWASVLPFGKPCCLGEPQVTSAMPGGSPILPPADHGIFWETFRNQHESSCVHCISARRDQSVTQDRQHPQSEKKIPGTESIMCASKLSVLRYPELSLLPISGSSQGMLDDAKIERVRGTR
jgi:hypothetical protein